MVSHSKSNYFNGTITLSYLQRNNFQLNSPQTFPVLIKPQIKLMGFIVLCECNNVKINNFSNLMGFSGVSKDVYVSA